MLIHKQRGMALWMLLGVGILAMGAVSIVGTVVWRHFDHIAELERITKEQATAIALHEANEVVFKQAIENEKKRNENLRQAMVEVETAREVADEKLEEAKKNLTYVRNIFADHDFEKLAKAKPGLISKRMQRATANVFSEFEDVANSF